jgi:DNA-binding transcriptional LysR family regulator
MDITLARTFLEIAASGSFVAAAKRLFVTQSAVSLRVRRLEQALGRPLFERSKAGAELTPYGREFERYALSMVRVWEDARQQIAIPAGFTDSLTIGGQYSLWPRLGFRWLDGIRKALPGVSLHAELGMADNLTRLMVEGIMQMALVYAPSARPGLHVEQILDEELVLVDAGPDLGETDPVKAVAGRYVLVDWGQEFIQSHALHFPELTESGMTLRLGALAARYIRQRGLAGYLPARAVKEYLDKGTMHLVANAPDFHYPAWVVWRDDIDGDIAKTALDALRKIAARIDAEQDVILHDLAALGDGSVQELSIGTRPGRRIL